MKPDFWHVHPGHVHSGHRHCHWLRYLSTVWTYCVSHDELNLSSGDSWRHVTCPCCVIWTWFLLFFWCQVHVRGAGIFSLSLALYLARTVFVYLLFLGGRTCLWNNSNGEEDFVIVVQPFFFFFFLNLPRGSWSSEWVSFVLPSLSRILFLGFISFCIYYIVFIVYYFGKYLVHRETEVIICVCVFVCLHMSQCVPAAFVFPSQFSIPALRGECFLLSPPPHLLLTLRSSFLTYTSPSALVPIIEMIVN